MIKTLEQTERIEGTCKNFSIFFNVPSVFTFFRVFEIYQKIFGKISTKSWSPNLLRYLLPMANKLPKIEINVRQIPNIFTGRFDQGQKLILMMKNPSHNTSLKLTGQIVGHIVPKNRLFLETSHFRRENKNH